MKTDELIDMMANDNAPEPWRGGVGQWAMLLAVGAVPSLVALFAAIGVRPDYMNAVAQPVVASKQLLPGLVAALALPALIAALRPEGNPRSALRWFWLPVMLAFGAAAWSLWQLPAGERWAAARGTSLLPCLALVCTLSLPITAAALALLRRGAPTDPAAAGMLAGLFAGCVSAVIYALHCYEDDPAFFGLWYTGGILLAGAVGRWAGRRWLSW